MTKIVANVAASATRVAMSAGQSPPPSRRRGTVPRRACRAGQHPEGDRGPGHPAFGDEAVACERMLGVEEQALHPPGERAPIGREAAHPAVGVLGAEEHLEERDLVRGERRVRHEFHSDRFATACAGDEPHLALHGEIDERSGCRAPIGIAEQRVTQHRRPALGRVLHHARSHALGGDGARDQTQHQDEERRHDREHDDSDEHAPSLGTRVRSWGTFS